MNWVRVGYIFSRSGDRACSFLIIREWRCSFNSCWHAACLWHFRFAWFPREYSPVGMIVTVKGSYQHDKPIICPHLWKDAIFTISPLMIPSIWHNPEKLDVLSPRHTEGRSAKARLESDCEYTIWLKRLIYKASLSPDLWKDVLFMITSVPWMILRCGTTIPKVGRAASSSHRISVFLTSILQTAVLFRCARQTWSPPSDGYSRHSSSLRRHSRRSLAIPALGYC